MYILVLNQVNLHTFMHVPKSRSETCALLILGSIENVYNCKCQPSSSSSLYVWNQGSSYQSPDNWKLSSEYIGNWKMTVNLVTSE